jgi:hypothetical protein
MAGRRNWRVYFASPVPSRWVAGAAPRLMSIQLLTDFGDTVTDAGHEGPWDSEEREGCSAAPEVLSHLFVALSLAAAEDPRKAAPRAVAGLLRVWSDRGGAHPLDPGRLPVSRDSTIKVWLSLEAGGQSIRDVDGVWLRLKGATILSGACPLPGAYACADGQCRHHPGGCLCMFKKREFVALPCPGLHSRRADSL